MPTYIIPFVAIYLYDFVGNFSKIFPKIQFHHPDTKIIACQNKKLPKIQFFKSERSSKNWQFLLTRLFSKL